MDTGTLIKVVAMISARIEVLENATDEYHINNWVKDEEYYILLAQSNILGNLKWELQGAIDADVAAMESATGE
jgi:hypothetical protein